MCVCECQCVCVCGGGAGVWRAGGEPSLRGARPEGARVKRYTNCGVRMGAGGLSSGEHAALLERRGAPARTARVTRRAAGGATDLWPPMDPSGRIRPHTSGRVAAGGEAAARCALPVGSVPLALCALLFKLVRVGPGDPGSRGPCSTSLGLQQGHSREGDTKRLGSRQRLVGANVERRRPGLMRPRAASPT